MGGVFYGKLKYSTTNTYTSGVLTLLDFRVTWNCNAFFFNPNLQGTSIPLKSESLSVGVKTSLHLKLPRPEQFQCVPKIENQ